MHGLDEAERRRRLTLARRDRVVHFQAEEQPRALQLEAFAKECSRLLPGAPPLSFGRWADAFQFVGDQASQAGPLVIALDEFQYLASSDQALVSTIQRIWDQWGRGAHSGLARAQRQRAEPHAGVADGIEANVRA